MIATQATGRPHDRTIASGIRPFDLDTDLRAVADLIALAFAQELDERGNSALREMRFMSNFGGFVGLINRSTGEFNDMLNGFVWVEDDKVVGNITVQRSDRIGSRWQIANVAVAPEYRGRGISRQLMQTALEHVARCGGEWAVLQVFARNDVARKLYDSLGFEQIGGMVDFQADEMPALAPPVPCPEMAPFRADNWQPLYELANHQLGAQAQWWRAINRADFEPLLEEQVAEWFKGLVGSSRVLRRAIQVSPRFEAALVMTAQRWRGDHLLRLWARPEHYGSHDLALLQWGLAALKDFPCRPIKIALSIDHLSAVNMLEYFGFRPLRTLLTLRKQIK